MRRYVDLKTKSESFTPITQNNKSYTDLYAELERYPPLTQDEERTLLKTYAENKCNKSLQKLCMHNSRIVLRMCIKYNKICKVDIMDMFVEGMYGFRLGIDKFDMNTQYEGSFVRLYTFCIHYVRKYIFQLIDKKSVVKTPSSLKVKEKEFNKWFESFLQKNLREPSLHQCIEENPQIPFPTLQYLHKQNTATLPDQVVYKEDFLYSDEDDFSSFFADSVFNLPLTEEEKQIIRMLYGFPPYSLPMNQKEIAEQLKQKESSLNRKVSKIISFIKDANL